MANKCNSYHLQPTTRYTYHPLTGRSIAHDIEVGVCWGTKECDQCNCGGDMAQCDFYPEVRKKALQEREPKFDEWISVDERLPDLEPTLIKYGSMGYKQKSIRVLCACKQKSGKVMVKEGYYEVWVENPSHACWRIPGSIDSVTHWMPLPAPPTEKEN